MANEMTVQKTESLSNSEAFTNKVLKEFGSNVAGNIQVTDYPQRNAGRSGICCGRCAILYLDSPKGGTQS